jgi:hypothetical protein
VLRHSATGCVRKSGERHWRRENGRDHRRLKQPKQIRLQSRRAPFKRQGYIVYPVNPNEPEVEGLATFKSIKDCARPTAHGQRLRSASRLVKLLPDIAAKGCDELWLNPGTESDAVMAEAERLGLNTIQACSIVAIGG